jgi:hypothetical protein
MYPLAGDECVVRMCVQSFGKVQMQRMFEGGRNCKRFIEYEYRWLLMLFRVFFVHLFVLT